jgi:serine/threonine protein kinase
MPVDSVLYGEEDTDARVGGCVDPQTLARLAVSEAFDFAELAEIRRHADTCRACVQTLSAMLIRRGGPAAEELAEVLLGRSLVKVGDVLVEKYLVEAVIGSGGMGTVVRAKHLQLNTRVAIKLIRGSRVGDPSAVRRLVKEARAAASLRSDHAVRVVDIEWLPNGVPYIVMEYLDGSPLSRVVAENGPLDQGRAVDLMLQVLEAVSEAHAVGIVHRDLTPNNLFLAKGEAMKVLDFGLSKSMAPADGAATTGTNTLVGSPHYLSPEQIGTPASVDARTDVWSLGASLFYLLTGRPPFVATNVYVLTTQILVEDAPRVSSLRPGIASRLDQIISRCLTRNVGERFQSATQLRDALESLRRDLGQKFVSTLKSEEELAYEASQVRAPVIDFAPAARLDTTELMAPADHEGFATIKDEQPGRGQTVVMNTAPTQPASHGPPPTQPSNRPPPAASAPPAPPAPAAPAAPAVQHPYPMPRVAHAPIVAAPAPHYSNPPAGPGMVSPRASSKVPTWLIVVMALAVVLGASAAVLAHCLGLF